MLQRLAPLLLLGLTACAGPAAQDDAVGRRVQDLQEATTAWAQAEDLAKARAAAETARNLLTGPQGPGYGDLDGDGRIGGARERGLLPGLRGEPGLAPQSASCQDSDVLGGDWSDAPARWAELERRIAAWRPDGNTFPALPSHPQRVIGWASLTLDATSVEQAQEYAGHAQLHVDLTRDDLDACR